MIRRLYIDNYRTLVNFELFPGPTNLFIGPNGSGKTSVLTVVSCLIDVILQGRAIHLAFPATTRTRWTTLEHQRFELEVDHHGEVFRYVLVVTHPGEGTPAIIESESVHVGETVLFEFRDQAIHLYNNQGNLGASFPYRGTRSFLAQLEERPETTRLHGFLDRLRRIWTLHVDAPGIEAEAKQEDEVLYRDAGNFASWYRHLAQESPEQISTLWSHLRQVLQGFHSLRLQRAGSHDARKLVAKFLADTSEYEVDFDELSDGQRVLPVLYALLDGHLSQDGVLFIDEPEAHVSLSEIQPWLQQIKERTEAGAQVFVVSHNPEVVDALASHNPWWFSRPGGVHTRLTDKPFKLDEGLLASQQIARGDLDG